MGEPSIAEKMDRLFTDPLPVIRFRIEVPHLLKPDDEYDYHEWVFSADHLARRGEAVTVVRDAIGRRNNGGWSRFQRWICNNTSCPGRLLVNEGDIEGHVSAQVEAATRRSSGHGTPTGTGAPGTLRAVS